MIDLTFLSLFPALVHYNDDDLLTEEQAAEYIGMSRSFLSKDRMNGLRHGRKQGPEYVRLGVKSIRYPFIELKTWVEKNRVVRQFPD